MYSSPILPSVFINVRREPVGKGTVSLKVEFTSKSRKARRDCIKVTWTSFLYLILMSYAREKCVSGKQSCLTLIEFLSLKPVTCPLIDLSYFFLLLFFIDVFLE